MLHYHLGVCAAITYVCGNDGYAWDICHHLSNDCHLVSANVLVWVIYYLHHLEREKNSVQSYVTLLSFITFRSRRTFPISAVCDDRHIGNKMLSGRLDD